MNVARILSLATAFTVSQACGPEAPPPNVGQDARPSASPPSSIPEIAAPSSTPTTTATDSATASATVSATTTATPTATASAVATPARKDGIDRVALRFQDASVPPPYHRSYVITLTPTTIRKVVDSYGDVISDDSAPLAEGEFDRVVDAMKALGLRGGAAASDGCSGGTGRTLEVFAGSKVVLTASSSDCGGKSAGPLARATKWIARVEELAPSSGPLGPSKK